MASFDYKAVTTLAIAMNIISYFITLIQRSQESFTYGTSGGGNIILSIIASLYGVVLSFIGSIVGMPEWFNALFTIPMSTILLMYTINKL